MTVVESTYPDTYRQHDATSLGQHLRHHNSVVLIGMKRVGISNFLRFFLNHDAVQERYIKNGTTHLFVPVDLNNLVEREITPFWMLVLKRIADSVARSALPEDVKTRAAKAFSDSIQLQDPFVTLDSVQQTIADIVAHDHYPTLFLVRFDRLKDAVTPAFFDNLQAVKDAARRQMSFVFTSFRPLYELCPDVFTKQSLSTFSEDLYLTPAITEDAKETLATIRDRYNLKLDPAVTDRIIEFAAGHVQYLHLCVMKLNELKSALPKTRDALFAELVADEQILLLSEELFDGLTQAERDVLLKLRSGKPISDKDRRDASYLWDTGMLVSSGTVSAIFSPLFADYVQKVSAPLATTADFTKKEHMLFSLLKSHEGELVERDAIISAVWPEQEELGVSDWAIDRLVARVRAKLKAQESEYKIQTVVTRGYKLVNKS